jgi:ferredoxin-NADP reductase
MIAGGSGITPVRSILSTVLATRSELSAHLVYGNRSEADVIFRDALEALAAAHPRRLTITHVLEAPPNDFDGITGRLDAAVLGAALDALPPARAPRLYYVCGPAAMMDAARAVLIARGVDERDIAEERFQSPGDPSTVTLPDRSVTVRLRVGARDHIVPVEPGRTLLEAGLAAGAAMPFSCAMGGCAACKGRLVAGEVALEEPNCLSPRERAEGFILTCCARPLGAVEVEVP